MDDFQHIDSVVFSEEFVRELAVDEETWMRKAIFVRPTTKEDLHAWIKLYLRLDFPDACIDPTSNCTPMEMIWETYNHARLNDDEKFYRVLYYSARGGYKTLGASVIEFLMAFLLQRNVAHMAAIVPQSLKAQEYLRRFGSLPVIREFVTRASARRIEFTRPDTGIVNYIQVIVCTMAGANFEHVPFMVIDEVDVVAHPEAYQEAMFIPAPMEGNLPITLLTSTRKFSFGLVQKEIDEAEKTGLKIRHWNAIDITERCSPNRHRPDLPRIPIYRSDKFLTAVSESDYMALPQDKAAEYVRDEGFTGCLQNCPLFAACQGRLAKQESTSKLLKPLPYLISTFKTVSPDKAKAQLLCWKPSKEGLIYATLDPDVHLKTAAEIAEMIDGVPRPPSFHKGELIAWAAKMVADGALKLSGGVDFGHTHNHVMVLAIKDGQGRSYVLDVLAVAEMELDQTISLSEERLLPFGGPSSALLYPDNAYPAYIKTYRRKGFRCADFKKDVPGGIETVRFALMDATRKTRLFFLKEDEGVQLLWTRMNQYHWKLDAAGNPTSEPDDDLDDECDAIRYYCQNEFTQSKGVVISTQQTDRQRIMSALPVETQPGYNNYLSKIIQDELAKKGAAGGPVRGKKGSLVWSIGDDSDQYADATDILRVLGKTPK